MVHLPIWTSGPKPRNEEHGEISRKHDNTWVGTSRKTYDRNFATAFSDEGRLNDVTFTGA
jgi:hypothetical protein